MKAVAFKREIKVAAFVIIISLTFAAYTQHAWEDYWVTFRASRNLATGHGLVFTSGERLHTFTSPLGVLLPAGLSWLTGNQSDNLVLWLFRLVSLGALAWGVTLLFRVLQNMHLRRVSCLLTVALIGLDAKTVDFSINGMETGLLLFFLALTIHGLLVAGRHRIIRLGVGWAGLMWTRPDSCVYIAILGLCVLLFMSNRAGGMTRGEWWRTLSVAGLICTVLYLPWFVWAWSYYGSPVPHTIIAKETNVEFPLSFVGILRDSLYFPAQLLAGMSSTQWTFLPAYAVLGGWHCSFHAVAIAFTSAAAWAWMIPLLRPQTRLFSLAFFLGNHFLTDVIGKYFPWYLPTVAVLGYLTIGLLFDQTLGLAIRLPQLGWARGWFRHLPKVLRVSAVLLMAYQLATTLCVARQMQVQQELIENGLRRQIGLWLRDHARTPHDTVMLEPLGYIGYFSGLKMFDYPGLSSKEMVEARRRLGREKENLAFLELKPDWLVLRPHEIEGGTIVDSMWVQKLYDIASVFDASKEVRAKRWLPGRLFLEFDQKFVIAHRKPDADLRPPD